MVDHEQDREDLAGTQPEAKNLADLPVEEDEVAGAVRGGAPRDGDAQEMDPYP